MWIDIDRIYIYHILIVIMKHKYVKDHFMHTHLNKILISNIIICALDYQFSTGRGGGNKNSKGVNI